MVLKIDRGTVLSLAAGLAAGALTVVSFGSHTRAQEQEAVPAPRTDVVPHRPRTPRDRVDPPPAGTSDVTAAVNPAPATGASEPLSPAAAPRPLDAMCCDTPYSPLGSIGHPWVSRLQWTFIESNIDWSSTDLPRLQKALRESLEQEQKLVATLPVYETAVAEQPWSREKFQCFAFFGSRLDVPVTSHVIIAGRDFSEPASPEESLHWWEAELGQLRSDARDSALQLLRDYEVERRKLMFRAFSRIFENRTASQPERPMCLLVVDNQIMLADSANLPALIELDQDYRALSLRRWTEALRSIGVSGGTK